MWERYGAEVAHNSVPDRWQALGLHRNYPCRFIFLPRRLDGQPWSPGLSAAPTSQEGSFLKAKPERQTVIAKFMSAVFPCATLKSDSCYNYILWMWLNNSPPIHTGFGLKTRSCRIRSCHSSISVKEVISLVDWNCTGELKLFSLKNPNKPNKNQTGKTHNKNPQTKWKMLTSKTSLRCVNRDSISLGLIMGICKLFVFPRSPLSS